MFARLTDTRQESDRQPVVHPTFNVSSSQKQRVLTAAAFTGARRALIALLALMLLPLALAGCFGEPASGPVEIKWDRDTCEVCRMLISDRHYAAQVRGGAKHKAHKFDDLGELIFWLDQQPWKNEPKVEIWVMDMDTGAKWLDARKAHYLPGQRSPMDYGFGAIESPRAKSVPFDEMVKKVKERGSTYHCLPPRESPA